MYDLYLGVYCISVSDDATHLIWSLEIREQHGCLSCHLQQFTLSLQQQCYSMATIGTQMNSSDVLVHMLHCSAA